ncbi:uncharacterized protein LOC108682677 isoform X2 [Hyalella azteca]|uniref:Uncharacterized protein LOC108682677 isoform X2 n=1 Tax=Hyalella azteca TaxID=294128 RepID=A0A8B7PPL0_HYAAZ|nr:uncharacterized protein LOC108682677 isoform X2 [Hyalella azteca]
MFPGEAPLVNIENQNMKLGPKLKNILHPSNVPAVDTKRHVCKSVDLQKPQIWSTKILQHKLQEQKKQVPDISLLVQQKVSSPSTSNRIKKKSVLLLNHPEEERVFRPVSDGLPTEEDVRATLQAQLNLNDQKCRVPSQPKESGPCISDWYNPADYIYSIPCTSLYETHTPTSSVAPTCVSASAISEELNAISMNL